MRPHLRFRRSLHLAVLLLAMDVSAAEGQRRRNRSTPDGRTVQVTGRERSYVLRAPRDPSGPLPLVIMLHGGGGNAANAESMSGLTPLVEREKILVAYPNGTGRLPDALLTWNAGHCCGYAMENRIDDVAFIDAMIDAIARETPVDLNRIYLTGMSNGAMMTHRLAASMRHRPAAIAPVVGAVFGDEPPPTSPVSALIFNGVKDVAVPTDGGLGNGVGRRSWDGVPPRPNEAQGAYWARAAGCDATPRTTTRDRLIHWEWSCPAGLAVELYQVTDGAHAWPGGNAGRRRADRPSDAIDATAAMWEFFKTRTADGRREQGERPGRDPWPSGVQGGQQVDASRASAPDVIRAPVAFRGAKGRREQGERPGRDPGPRGVGGRGRGKARHSHRDGERCHSQKRESPGCRSRGSRNLGSGPCATTASPRRWQPLTVAGYLPD